MELFGEASNKCEVNLQGEGIAVRPGELWAELWAGCGREPNDPLLLHQAPGEEPWLQGISSFPSMLPQHLSPRELCFVGGWICLLMTGSHYVTLTSLELSKQTNLASNSPRSRLPLPPTWSCIINLLMATVLVFVTRHLTKAT